MSAYLNPANQAYFDECVREFAACDLYHRGRVRLALRLLRVALPLISQSKFPVIHHLSGDTLTFHSRQEIRDFIDLLMEALHD